MSKDDHLTDHLQRPRVPAVRMSFAEIERVIGRKLPPSASQHRAWWSNQAGLNVLTRAWLDAGFQSEQVDIAGRQLTFLRMQPAASASPATPGSLLGWLRGTVVTAAEVDLTTPADPAWANAEEHA